ncbi:hypothetical protein KQH42_06240 [Streptomyces sp. CHA1]|uniref:DUF6578 domain-containing protein n=1 Tax=Actinomycetes TaxID=1760 RepID=UPI0003C2ECF9|nr:MULTISPECIES: DUF6578 domain-containing protein [unclassified Streptomyces]WDV32150.1 hypothetical protein OIM90_15110 [Streptomyces sp. AD16]WSB21520.1 hypothetical protein OHB02_15375 [Streptomyces albidoflavus]ESP98727.1 Hypothetical protein B591_14885 [Streptomyces sp. GBA 94-10 4N24]ESQ05230.1 Hypothetical protein B590_14788 [Streptomyces sp. PVA_94-07]MBP3078557.1 hypothetical protein [Streptomyces sp. 604F]
MTVTIWIEGRQMQCCGRRVRSGAVVEWHVVEAGAEDHADAGRAAERPGAGFVGCLVTAEPVVG